MLYYIVSQFYHNIMA